MNDYDPYKAPESHVADVSMAADSRADAELASRWRRLFASLFDGFLQMLFVFPLMYYLGVWESAMRGETMPVSQEIGFGIFGMVLFLILNGYLLKKYGQTIGKKLLKIRIVTLDGELPGFNRLIGLRVVPVWVVTYIPVIGYFLAVIDSLFIFRKDRRCAHDLIAGTKVVNV